MSRVYVVGVGLHTSLGSNLSTNWKALLSGRSGVRRISRFNTEYLPTKIAATIDDNPNLSCGKRSIQMGKSVIRQATEMTGIRIDEYRRAGFFFAAPTPENDWGMMLASIGNGADELRELLFVDECNSWFGEALQSDFEPDTPATMVNTACASGATALEMAMESIQDGEFELAVVAGSDSSVFDESIARFCLLSALSTTNETPTLACRPFSIDRDGFVMGEGAGALILASETAVEKNNLTPLAMVRGAGNATDGFHRTRSNPDGSTIISSMERAIENSGISPNDICHINAHGTGTPENDKMESFGIRQVFGERSYRLPVTANKSMIGHTLTAAGAIEAVISVLSICRNLIPPTANTSNLDLDLGVDVVSGAPRKMRVKNVLSNSFGFGGQNVSIVFSQAGEV